MDAPLAHIIWTPLPVDNTKFVSALIHPCRYFELVACVSSLSLGVCPKRPGAQARARRERRWARASRVAALLVAVVAVYAVVHVLAARRRRRERVAATEFKAKVAPYLVEAPEL